MSFLEDCLDIRLEKNNAECNIFGDIVLKF